jgi:hypothetical protein
MKIKDLLNELKKSLCYNEFKKIHPDGFLCAGFFILSKSDKEGDKFQLDFLIPKEEKIVSFEYPFNSYKIHPEKIKNIKKVKDLRLKIDLDQINEKVKKEFNKDFKKLIAVFQNDSWNITCIEDLDIKRIKFNAYNGVVENSGDLKISDILRVEKT